MLRALADAKTASALDRPAQGSGDDQLKTSNFDSMRSRTAACGGAVMSGNDEDVLEHLKEGAAPGPRLLEASLKKDGAACKPLLEWTHELTEAVPVLMDTKNP